MWQYRFGTSFGRQVAQSNLGWVGAGLALAASLAGCSADVMRLDSPSGFGFSDSSPAVTRPQASMSRSSAGIGSVDPAQASTYSPPPALNPGSVRMAALPEPPAASPAPSYSPPPQNAPAYQPSAKPAAPGPAPVAASERGDAIQVQPGDTLYGLSKRYHVSISELMSLNALTSPNLRPGQSLYLPAGKSANHKPITRQPEVANAAAPAAALAVAPPAGAVALSAETIAKYDGSYTVKKGDNLYGLALQFHVPPSELQQVNNISDVRKVRPGAVLKVPSAALAALPPQAPIAAVVPPAPAVASVAAATIDPAVKVPPQVVAAALAPAAGGPQTVLLNGEKRVATADAAVLDAQPVSAAADQASQAASSGVEAGTGVGKLRWPVKGKVIGTFGSRPDGTHNDGVNFSVPLGTEVHAAEAGVVAYAGSELKGYGNLILVRHDNGWITAYAHNEEILAKRGDKIKRGQIIAKAGKSGQVDQPQVHFELRQGSKPVDPTPFMEKI